MATKPKQLFSFQSDAPGADTFTVVRFDGVEALSSLFRFDITLMAESSDIDLAELLRHAACLTVRGKEAGDLRYHGILSRCTLERPTGDKFIYQARLVPLTWRLTLIKHNQVFLNRSIPQILDTILRDGDLSPADFDFRLQGEYEPREYMCQYGESHYDFIARRMEQNGIYTFYDHLADRDCLVITDTLVSHKEPTVGGQLIYAPDSGLDDISKTKSVQRFIDVRSLVPGSVRLRDYN
ncbi:MAG: type VI secretion system tip protein VgrG, partial [Candidatus Electrothrix sp. AR4]|nr:type VI secretion system tip protein VgrG [Candidatus Electrothrix sp. AR4]